MDELRRAVSQLVPYGMLNRASIAWRMLPGDTEVLDDEGYSVIAETVYDNQADSFCIGCWGQHGLRFPIRVQLRRSILSRIHPRADDVISNYAAMGFDRHEVVEFAVAFARSGVQSIDAFLEHRPEFINLGKTAIAEALIPFEAEEKLFGQQVDWYGYLLDWMNSSVDRFQENSLVIVSFNYDRSFEWYFFKALQARYGVDERSAVEMMQSIPVIHPHGTLGALPWERNGREYSPSVERRQIYAARDMIKVIHDVPENDADLNRAIDCLSSAQRIFFLGFGYHRVNIKRLQPARWGNDGNHAFVVFGSAYGLTEMEKLTAGNIIGVAPVGWGARDWDVLTFLREKINLEQE